MLRFSSLVSLLSSGTVGFRVVNKRRVTPEPVPGETKSPAAEEYDYSGDGDYGGDGSENGDVCLTDWSDPMRFDCQLYEGAGWCDKTKFHSMGYGWCHRLRKCSNAPVRNGGWALRGQAAQGWGTFKAFMNRHVTARQVCAGCGAKCPQVRSTRKLNAIKEGCVDYSAPNEQVWRGPSGYTCGAYHHGGFCRWVNNTWQPGKLMEGYGELTSYRHWVKNGTGRTRMDPLQACCSCGGGCQCTHGWKAPKLSQCAREFVYQGKGYSGCTTAANRQVKGGGAWCAHDLKYKRGAWSRCVPCEAGWEPKPGSGCSSEFTYNGTTYSGCTLRTPTETQAWCAHDAVARGDRWSRCDRCKGQ